MTKETGRKGNKIILVVMVLLVGLLVASVFGHLVIAYVIMK